ncbi:MAG: class I SAM-dependent methyltransferase [Firmicutes bacterium]|nr:class I SAM-dependent methyltransferase [Bacillota bacterium]
MSYTYPDKNDLLTCQLIDTEFDAKYWGESEEEVLHQAMEQVDHLAGKRRAKGLPFTLLDLGCGMGRLFPVYAQKVDEITAAEPDEERWQAAVETASETSRQTGTPIDVRHGDVRVLPEDRKYSVVVSSHVMQHITCGMAADLMTAMAKRLEPNGLLIMTTTYTDGDEDLFFRESWKDGERFNEIIDREGFNQSFGAEGVLPVRMFAEQSILHLADGANLELVRMSRYHYQQHHSAAEDVEANLSGEGEGARDVMYIFRRRLEVDIDGNICYHFSFSIYDEEVGLRLDDEQELRDAIRKAYPAAVFIDDENAKEEQFYRELATSQGFLHGGGLPFNCFRVLLKDYDLQFAIETRSSAGVRKTEYDIKETRVFMTVFPESDTVQVCICLSVMDAEENDYVYFRHVQGNGAKMRNRDGRMLSIRDIFNEISGCLHRNVSDVAENYFLEIKRFGDYEKLEEILQTEQKLLYGMMTGDEGWKHVPLELADQRLQNRWGSRDFIRLISFGSNSLFFNLSKSPDAVNYRANRLNFDHSYYGDMDPYFSLDSDTAGLNHGIIFSMELVMVIKTICNRILRRQASHYSGKEKGKPSEEIRRIKKYRGELITTLNKVENLSISEIGEMERVLLIGQQIDPLIEKIKYLLELLESELDLLYNTSTNRLGNMIAVGGLIFAGIQILLAL